MVEFVLERAYKLILCFPPPYCTKNTWILEQKHFHSQQQPWFPPHCSYITVPGLCHRLWGKMARYCIVQNTPLFLKRGFEWRASMFWFVLICHDKVLSEQLATFLIASNSSALRTAQKNTCVIFLLRAATVEKNNCPRLMNYCQVGVNWKWHECLLWHMKGVYFFPIQYTTTLANKK